MPDVTLSGWAASASVSAYARSGTPPNGATGSALDTGTASSGGVVTLTVPVGGPYIATDGTRTVNFGPVEAAESVGIPEPDAWTRVTPKNGWEHYDEANPGSAGEFEGVSYVIAGGMVFLRGVLDGSGQTDVVAFTMPEEAQPSKARRIVIGLGNGTAQSVALPQNGDVTGAASEAFVYFDTSYAL